MENSQRKFEIYEWKEKLVHKLLHKHKDELSKNKGEREREIEKVRKTGRNRQIQNEMD